MNQKEDDRATLTAVLNRFQKWRRPQILDIKERLERGETLTDRDLDFLGRVYEAMKDILPILERNPEYYELEGKAISLFQDIARLALENEQVKPQKPGD